MDKLELLEKKMDRIKVLMDATGESIEQMLAHYADDKVDCDECPLKVKCIPVTITDYKTCHERWLEFLEVSDE